MGTAESSVSAKTRAPIGELVASARYLVNEAGIKTDVVLPLARWEELLDWIEDLEDRSVVRAWLPRLREGPVASGALEWDEVAGDWDDEQ